MRRLFHSSILSFTAATLVLLVGLSACSSPPERPTYTDQDVDVVTEWVEHLYGVIRVERISPPAAARIFGYSNIALYESMVHGLPELQSMEGQVNGLTALPAPDAEAQYDWLTVAITAQEHVVDTLLYEAQESSRIELAALAERQRTERRDGGVSRSVAERSVAYGATLGDVLAEWAMADGYVATRDSSYDYEEPYEGPDDWVPTATAAQNTALMVSPATDYVDLGTDADTKRQLDAEMASERMLVVNRPDSWLNPHRALEPHWQTLRTMVTESSATCRAKPPVPYSEAPGSPFYEEVEAVYDSARTATQEQITIARFWSDCPGHTGTPPGHWARIGSQLTDQLELSMTETVEMFGLLGVAMHEAFLSAWDTKYDANLVRPVTFIHEHIDPEWQTWVVTPPFPEYTSAHSVVSAASARVLAHLFGEEVPFTDRSMAWLGFEDRTFPSFAAAAKEAADSRVFGGIHYPMASYTGLDQGECVAEQVLKTVRTRPAITQRQSESAGGQALSDAR